MGAAIQSDENDMPMFHNREFLRLLWLYYGLDMKDTADWSRALLAWKYGLTPEEMRVIELIAAGCENKEITLRLGLIDENTIKSRIKSIFRKMRVDSRVRVATIAVQFGLVNQDEHLSHPEG